MAHLLASSGVSFAPKEDEKKDIHEHEGGTKEGCQGRSAASAQLAQPPAPYLPGGDSPAPSPHRAPPRQGSNGNGTVPLDTVDEGGEGGEEEAGPCPRRPFPSPVAPMPAWSHEQNQSFSSNQPSQDYQDCTSTSHDGYAAATACGNKISSQQHPGDASASLAASSFSIGVLGVAGNTATASYASRKSSFNSIGQASAGTLPQGVGRMSSMDSSRAVPLLPPTTSTRSSSLFFVNDIARTSSQRHPSRLLANLLLGRVSSSPLSGSNVLGGGSGSGGSGDGTHIAYFSSTARHQPHSQPRLVYMCFVPTPTPRPSAPTSHVPATTATPVIVFSKNNQFPSPGLNPGSILAVSVYL